MIINFKIFENKYKEPQVGDFVICNMGSSSFLRDNEEPQMIGEIIKVDKYDYSIRFFQKLPLWLRGISTSIKDTVWFSRNSIIEWSENREDLEAILDSEKYNL